MENKQICAALRLIERDNAEELEKADGGHRFSFGFNRRALAVCRGGAADERNVRRRMPVWAAALIAVLVCLLLAGCAVAVIRYFTRYIPGYGIVDAADGARMYATDGPVRVADMNAESVLYVSDGSSGRLYLWASGPDISGGGFDGSWMNEPVFMLRTDRGEYPVYAHGGSTGRESFYECMADEVPAFTSASLCRGEDEVPIELSDISDKGYTVSAWAEYDGITVKALPLYSYNRVVIMRAEGIANSKNVSATLTVYDSLGNTARVGSGSEENGWMVLTANKKLPGEIVKIEINSLRVHCTAPDNAGFEFLVPKTDGEYAIDGRLIDNDVFTENAVSIKREGDFLYLTTKIDAHRYRPLTDFYVDYDSHGARIEDWNTRGIDTVIYKLKIGSDTDSIALTVNEYVYMIRGEQDGPLGVIEIKKSR